MFYIDSPAAQEYASILLTSVQAESSVILRHPNPPRTAEVLAKALVEEWDCIPQKTIDKLVLSMPIRLTAVRKAIGTAVLY